MAIRGENNWIISSQDIVSAFECDHRLSLNLAKSAGLITKPEQDDPELELLIQRGKSHERQILEALRETKSLVELSEPDFEEESMLNDWQKTEDAMNKGVEVIYQATLFTGDALGLVDFLVLAKDDQGKPLTGDNGKYVYEPVDAKSSKSAKPKAVLQVGFYGLLLEKLGWPKPNQVHLWLAGGNDFSGEASKPMAIAQSLFDELHQRLSQPIDLPNPIWGPKISACTTCDWKDHCAEGRRTDRDLSLVQGITSKVSGHLRDSGIKTIDALAKATTKPKKLRTEAFEKLRDQAALQIKGEQTGKIEWEFRDKNSLQLMPAASQGDIWFDMEGDPYADNGNGLEYMFGFSFLKKNSDLDFKDIWGHDREGEKKAFEEFIDWVMNNWKKYPEMHVYHYADYERRALLALSQKYSTREEELDQILRNGLLVDLFKIVKQGFKFSTESLSIKDIEVVYGRTHKDGDVQTSMGSVVEYERYIEQIELGETGQAQKILDGIREYNKLDCDSTYDLDRWIRERCEEEGISPKETGLAPLEIEVHKTDDALLADRLLENVPIEPEKRTELEQAKAVMAASILFPNRELRPTWWQIFDLMKSELDEIDTASGALVVGDASAEEWYKEGRQVKLRRNIRVSGESQHPADVFNVGSEVYLIYELASEGMGTTSDSARGNSKAKITEFTLEGAVIEETLPQQAMPWDSLPIAIIPGPPISMEPIKNRLMELGESLVGLNSIPNAAWTDILSKKVPRIDGGLEKSGNREEQLAQALLSCDSSYVAVQGPPGTGKTYVGSRAVYELAKKGWKIGVVSQSHKVVEHFLEEVIKLGEEVPVGKKPKTGSSDKKSWVIGKPDDWALDQPDGFVLGGTAWTFVTPGVLALGLDLIVVDEAGQFSLPMTIAAASSARNVLLLGDPQQLPQVSRASHPEGVETSSLEHVSLGQATLPSDRGYFLETTYRMSPPLTKKVSDLQYLGKLTHAPSVQERNLDDSKPGLFSVETSHSNNTTSSEEEALRVLELVRGEIGKTWNPGNGKPIRELDQDDFIVVTPFNDQVRLISRTLESNGLGDIRVGTVDKFQGQEAPIAIVSMATSSSEELPRGIDFVLNPNRLNVSISRGQWAAYLVHSSELKKVQPSSIEGMMQLGGFLQLVD